MSSLQFQPMPPTAFAPPRGADASGPPAGIAGPFAAPATSADGVATRWSMRSIPTPVPGNGSPPESCDGNIPGQGNAASGGFLRLIDKLVNELGTMIGNMLGDGSTATDPGSTGTGAGSQTLATLFGGASGAMAADPSQTSAGSGQPIAFG
jgi:hypothetical protein